VIDRQGHEQPLSAKPRAYAYPRISPDGTKIAVASIDEENDIWIWHIAKETPTRLTFGPAQENYPVWTPDSRRVIFRSADGWDRVSACADRRRHARV
jgi:Tol biopolymer transport system component